MPNAPVNPASPVDPSASDPSLRTTGATNAAISLHNPAAPAPNDRPAAHHSHHRYYTALADRLRAAPPIHHHHRPSSSSSSSSSPTPHPHHHHLLHHSATYPSPSAAPSARPLPRPMSVPAVATAAPLPPPPPTPAAPPPPPSPSPALQLPLPPLPLPLPLPLRTLPSLAKWMTPAVVAAGYVVVAVISEGSFGTVLKAAAAATATATATATSTATATATAAAVAQPRPFVAIKAVPKARLSAKETAAIRKQALALRTLTHRYIVHFHDDFDDDDYFYHVFEYLHGGDLYDRLEARGKPFSEPQVLFLARQVFHAVSYLHAKRAAHRDIKLENFVFETGAADDRQVMKLIDFDLLIVRSRQSPRAETCSDMCGTILYVSPDIAAGREHIPEESDMWACGVLLYVLLSYQMPFQGATGRQILRAVRTTEPHFAPAVWAHVSPPTKALVRDLLRKNAAERPTADQALDRVRAIQAAGRQAGLPGFAAPAHHPAHLPSAALHPGPAATSRLRSALRGLRSVSLNIWDPSGNLARRGSTRAANAEAAAAAVAASHAAAAAAAMAPGYGDDEGAHGDYDVGDATHGNGHSHSGGSGFGGRVSAGGLRPSAFRPGDWRTGAAGGTRRRRGGGGGGGGDGEQRRSRSNLVAAAAADNDSTKSGSVSGSVSAASSLRSSVMLRSVLGSDGESDREVASSISLNGATGTSGGIAGAVGRNSAMARLDGHARPTSTDGGARLQDGEFATSPALGAVWTGMPRRQQMNESTRYGGVRISHQYQRRPTSGMQKQQQQQQRQQEAGRQRHSGVYTGPTDAKRAGGGAAMMGRLSGRLGARLSARLSGVRNSGTTATTTTNAAAGTGAYDGSGDFGGGVDRERAVEEWASADMSQVTGASRGTGPGRTAARGDAAASDGVMRAAQEEGRREGGRAGARGRDGNANANANANASGNRRMRWPGVSLGDKLRGWMHIGEQVH